MSLLFSSPVQWWTEVTIELGKLVQSQIYFFEWSVQEKIETYGKFCNLYKNPEYGSLSAINGLVRVLSTFIEVDIIEGRYCARISRGVTLSDACVLLYGASTLFRRVRTKLYYDKSYKAVLSSLGSLRNALGGLVEFCREHLPGNAEVVNRECDQISNELGALLRAIKEDINLVCFFFGVYHKKMYEKMSRIENFKELVPKSDHGEFEECAICMDRRMTPCTDITILDSCLHVFCSPCALTWFSTKDRCPMCRAKIKHFASKAQFELFKKRQNEFKQFHKEREMRKQSKSSRRNNKYNKSSLAAKHDSLRRR